MIILPRSIKPYKRNTRSGKKSEYLEAGPDPSDGERISFLTPNYTKIVNAMQTQPAFTLADMLEITGISIAAIQKLLDQLIRKK